MARFFTHVGNSLQSKNKLEKEVIELFKSQSNLILRTEGAAKPILFFSNLKQQVIALNTSNPRCRKVEVSWQENNDGGIGIYTTNGFVTMQIYKSRN